VQFDHRQRKIKAEALGLFNHLQVQVEGSVCIVARWSKSTSRYSDLNKDTQFDRRYPRPYVTLIGRPPPAIVCQFGAGEVTKQGTMEDHRAVVDRAQPQKRVTALQAGFNGPGTATADFLPSFVE